LLFIKKSVTFAPLNFSGKERGFYSLFCCKKIKQQKTFSKRAMENIGRIQELLKPYLENGKYYLVDLSISSARKSPVLSLLLDTDEGISIDECALISRKLGNDIEAENIFDTPFTLEVSSPGVDTPLKSLRQYTKNIGRTLKISLLEGEKLTGKLISVTEEKLEILEEVLKGKLKSVKKEPTFIHFNKIKSAQVQVSFS
jgi:ribosome maturation factor RimP